MDSTAHTQIYDTFVSDDAAMMTVVGPIARLFGVDDSSKYRTEFIRDGAQVPDGLLPRDYAASRELATHRTQAALFQMAGFRGQLVHEGAAWSRRPRSTIELHFFSGTQRETTFATALGVRMNQWIIAEVRVLVAPAPELLTSQKDRGIIVFDRLTPKMGGWFADRAGTEQIRRIAGLSENVD